MNWKEFFDNKEELFIGACLQFPLYFIVHWWVILIMIACGLLWRAGGVTGGNHLFRRLGVPIVICGSTFISCHHWQIMIAVPFMILWCPASYGEDSWLYKWLKNDFKVRGILFAWYWAVFFIAFIF